MEMQVWNFLLQPIIIIINSFFYSNTFIISLSLSLLSSLYIYCIQTLIPDGVIGDFDFIHI